MIVETQPPSRLSRWAILTLLVLGISLACTPVQGQAASPAVSATEGKEGQLRLNFQTISNIQVTNNSDMTLYQIQIRFDLPQGLSTNDVQINKMTRTDDTTVNLDGVIWDTSIFMEDGTSGNHDIIIMHLDRVLPGDSNIVAFSLDTNAATVSQPIKISCAGYSKKQSSILTQ